MTDPLRTPGGLALHGVTTLPDVATPALDVTFEAARRELTALLGASGSGKTATLRAIAGLEVLTGGRVLVDGIDVTARPPHLRGLGFVPHGLGLVPELSVADNIRFGLTAARLPLPERTVRLSGLLQTIDMLERSAEPVGQLTHIEQLRVAIARAMTTDPTVLLLDDPLGGLPDRARERGRRELRLLLSQLPVGALIATADVDDVAALATDVAVIEHGTVVQTGSVRDVIAGPSLVSVASLAGYEVLIEGHGDGAQITEAGVGALSLPEDIAPGAIVQVMAHPAAVLAVPRGHGLGFGVSGTVVNARPLGPVWMVEVALGSRATLLVRWEWDPDPPAEGTIVDLIASARLTFVDGVRHTPTTTALDGHIGVHVEVQTAVPAVAVDVTPDGDLDLPGEVPLSGTG